MVIRFTIVVIMCCSPSCLTLVSLYPVYSLLRCIGKRHECATSKNKMTRKLQISKVNIKTNDLNMTRLLWTQHETDTNSADSNGQEDATSDAVLLSSPDSLLSCHSCGNSCHILLCSPWITFFNLVSWIRGRLGSTCRQITSHPFLSPSYINSW